MNLCENLQLADCSVQTRGLQKVPWNGQGKRGLTAFVSTVLRPCMVATCLQAL